MTSDEAIELLSESLIPSTEREELSALRVVAESGAGTPKDEQRMIELVTGIEERLAKMKSTIFSPVSKAVVGARASLVRFNRKRKTNGR